MVVLSKPETEHLFLSGTGNGIPIIEIDLSNPESKEHLIKACEEFGFFKVINHGIPMDFISQLESEALKFFSLPLSEKQEATFLGYGNKRIGDNGDVGWVEYLLFTINQQHSNSHNHNYNYLRGVLDAYISAVQNLACQILEMMAEGLRIQPRNVLSKFLKDEESDSVFRLNHYPPCAEAEEVNNRIGFGEHTDPQIISVLRSNNTTGLEISVGNKNWVPVPADHKSFFINVGDSLQVMTNGRFKSVRHRVVANSVKSRVSMIYFGGPPLSEKIAPLMKGEQGESLYREFTWFEYKKSAFNSRLADNRLRLFQSTL
ncbi:gibberellin 2-beta-dioxygenase 1-like [Euphorbia lathyris]|uniref:gibberellin 2-beta-dioxygenase 1-like n=1 Tax=Euphorbia lathyris TaxID=212925 RepID=UPI00331368C5